MRFRVLVDYNTEEDDGKISINTLVYSAYLEVLKDGMELTLCDHDGLEVDAIAYFDEHYKWWYGIPDWSTRRDVDPPQT